MRENRDSGGKSGNLINAGYIHTIGRIQLQPLLRTRFVHVSPQAVNTPERTMRVEALPRIQPHVLLPERPSLGGHQVSLFRQGETPNRLPRRRALVPYYRGVLGRMMNRVRAELDADVVDSLVVFVKVGEPVA